MRVVALVLALLCASCGELRGATEFSDAYYTPADIGTRDTARADTAGTPNALQGEYNGTPLEETRAAFRLDSAKTPGQPWLVFVTSASKVSLGCDAFKTDGWKQRLPDSADVHEFHLGGTTTGTYEVNNSEPLGPGRVIAERTTKTSAPVAGDRARSGTVTLSRFDLTGASGTFRVIFESWVVDEDPPVPDSGPIEERVEGVFDVASCAVDW